MNIFYGTFGLAYPHGCYHTVIEAQSYEDALIFMHKLFNGKFSMLYEESLPKNSNTTPIPTKILSSLLADIYIQEKTPSDCGASFVKFDA